MKFINIVSVLVLLAGCLIQTESSNVSVSLDHDDETPTSFEDCRDAIGGLAGNKVNFAARGHFHGCRITFGISHHPKGKSMLRGKAYLGSSYVNLKGNLLPVAKIMDLNQITCEKLPQQQTPYTTLRFKFPTGNTGHADYKHVDINCPFVDKEDDKVKVNIDLVYHSIDKTLLLDVLFGDFPDSGTYHFFDTDKSGVIKKHVKVLGSKGKEITILDDYKLQGTD